MRAAALVLLALLLAGCASAPAPASGDATWSFVTLDGDRVTPDEPARNATVLFFMATWCSSCRAKAPVLAEAHAEHAAQGVAFYSVDFDPSESREEIVAWQQRYGHAWPHAVDEERAVQRALGVTQQSSVAVLDRAGGVERLFGYGEVEAGELRAAISAALD